MRINVHGLGDPDDSDTIVRIAPGAIGRVSFNAKTPGLYFVSGARRISLTLLLLSGMLVWRSFPQAELNELFGLSPRLGQYKQIDGLVRSAWAPI